MTLRGLSKTIALLILAALFALTPVRAFSRAQEGSVAAQPSENNASHGGAESAKEGHEGSVEEEENQDLKHSGRIQWLSRVTGLSIHQAHLLGVVLNFVILIVLLYFLSPTLMSLLTGKRSLGEWFRSRTDAIHHALEEGRAASQEANRRLADIEARLGKLDSEITQMQSQSEKEASAEDGRIKQAAEEDIRKVVQAAEQEIASAAKQARRELSVHTADLAVALARKQIHVDANSDQALVRTFAVNLSSDSGGKDRS